MAYPKIRMEKPSVYNGLDWLVALDEGLFAKEGLEVELVAHGGEQKTNVKVTNWNEVRSNAGHAEAVECGSANIFNACEWGNYRRSQDTGVGCRQLGRRASVVAGAVAVPPGYAAETMRAGLATYLGTSAKAGRDLGWHARDLDTGLRETVAALRG